MKPLAVLALACAVAAAQAAALLFSGTPHATGATVN
jgi:hypothetical protein